MVTARLLLILLAAIAGLTIAAPGRAQDAPANPPTSAEPSSAAGPDHAFLPAPHRDLNRVYRVDRATGEMGLCQYAAKASTVGVTLCFPPGEGAGPQEPGAYDLVASHHLREQGVFRVERRSGRMSVCYYVGEQVVCTPQAR